MLPRPSENLPRILPTWPGLHQKPPSPTMQECVREHYPTKHNGQQQPSTRPWPPGRGLRYQSTCICFVPSSPASQAHYTPACPPRGTRDLDPDCFHCTVYMDESPPGMLASSYSKRLQRRRTAREAPSPGPCIGQREVSSCLRSPETCRHWHVEAHRDASQGAGLLTTIRRQLKHSLRRSAWDPRQSLAAVEGRHRVSLQV